MYGVIKVVPYSENCLVFMNVLLSAKQPKSQIGCALALANISPLLYRQEILSTKLLLQTLYGTTLISIGPLKKNVQKFYLSKFFYSTLHSAINE